MKNLSILFATLLIGLAAQPGFAQNEKELVIKTARALETAPLAKESVKMRERALLWVIETDQVSVMVCGGIFRLFF